MRNYHGRTKRCLHHQNKLDAEIAHLTNGNEVSEKFFLMNQSIRNKNLPWRSCLLTDRDEISNLDKVPHIEPSRKVWFDSAKRFQRSWLKCEKLKTDDGHQVKNAGTVFFRNFFTYSDAGEQRKGEMYYFIFDCFSPSGEWADPDGAAIPGHLVGRPAPAPNFSPCCKTQFNIEVPTWGT